MRNAWIRWWVAVALGAGMGLFGGACDIDEEPVEPADNCDLAGGTRVVGGDWLLTGRGRRVGCEDGRYNTGSFSFEAQGFRVGQDGSTLQLDARPQPSVPGAYFTFTRGQVRGICVEFRTQEGSAEGPDLTMEFDGTLTPEGEIVGTFEGSGPPGCISEGTFRIEIIGWTGPPPLQDVVQPPGEDAGPTDVTPDVPQSGGADVAPDTTAPVDVAADLAAGDAAAVSDVLGDLADAAVADDVAAAPTDAAVAADGVGSADSVSGPDGAGTDAAATPSVDAAGSGGGNGGSGTDSAGGFCSAAPAPAAAPPLLLALAVLVGLLQLLRRRAHDRKN